MNNTKPTLKEKVLYILKHLASSAEAKSLNISEATVKTLLLKRKSLHPVSQSKQITVIDQRISVLYNALIQEKVTELLDNLEITSNADTYRIKQPLLPCPELDELIS